MDTATTPVAWLVKWNLLGQPWRVSPEMLLEIPEEAFPYLWFQAHNGNTSGMGSYLHKDKRRLALLFWNKKTGRYKASILNARGPASWKRLDWNKSLEDTREWLRQQI